MINSYKDETEDSDFIFFSIKRHLWNLLKVGRVKVAPIYQIC
jgi:hypothetical protein